LRVLSGSRRLARLAGGCGGCVRALAVEGAGPARGLWGVCTCFRRRRRLVPLFHRPPELFCKYRGVAGLLHSLYMWGAKMDGVDEKIEGVKRYVAEYPQVPALPSTLCKSWAPAQRRKVSKHTRCLLMRGRGSAGLGSGRDPSQAVHHPLP